EAVGPELEGGVLVVERVVVAAGEQWPEGKRAARAVDETPVERDRRPAGLDEETVLDPAAVWQREHPGRPGLGLERLDALGAIGMDHVRRVVLRREGERAARGFEPGLEPVHQHDAAGGRRGCGQEKRVVAPR